MLYKLPQSPESITLDRVQGYTLRIDTSRRTTYRMFSTKSSEDDAQPPSKVSALSIVNDPKNRRGLQCLLRCMKKEARIVIPTFLALVASSGLISMFPAVIGNYINNFSATNVPSIFQGACFVFLSAVSSFLKTILSGFATTRMSRRMREDLYTSLLKKDISFFDTTSSGRLSSVVASDVAISAVIVDYLCQALRSSISFVFGICFSLKLAPITLIGHTMLPILVSLSLLFPLSRCVQRYTSLQMRCLSAIVSHAEERLYNIKTVKAFNAEKYEYGAFMDKVRNLFGAAITTSFYSASMNFVAVGAVGTLILFMANTSSTLVLDGTMMIGDVTSLLMYTVMVGGSIQSFTSSFSGIQKCVGAASSVASYIEDECDDSTRKKALLSKSPKIEFRNVSFAYPTRAESSVIKNMSFVLPTGSILVFFGESGCGKSSIIQLLLGFYKPTSGSILIDDVMLEDMDLQGLRSSCGWVEQQVTLFHDTIRKNVLYGQENDNVDLTDAYKMSGLSEVLNHLADGDETTTGQLGKSLSGGQRQRIALARMFARDPKIVLLDEASAALDMESEERLNKALLNFLRNRTTIIVSHRPSLLSLADYVMVMGSGTVYQFGTKQDVLQSPCAQLAKILSVK